MKKILVLILITCVSAFIFAENIEALISLDSSLYSQIENLYEIEGQVMPLSLYPWTKAEAKGFLDSLETNTPLGSYLKGKILDDLNLKDNIYVGAGIAANTEMLFHTNSNNLNNSKDYIANLNKPILDLIFDFGYKENFSFLVDFSGGLVSSKAQKINSITSSELRYNKMFATNILFLSEGTFDLNMPNRSYVLLNYSPVRFILGRDKLKLGNGLMGNMVLGNQAPYHDYFSLSFVSKNFSYQMLVSVFAHSNNLNTTDDRSPLLNANRLFTNHRFEGHFFNNKLMVALNDALMYQSENGYLDFRVFLPMQFMHNFYIAGNSNSFLSLEIEYAISKNILLYAQIGVDDLAVPGEPQAGDKNASVDGYGFQLGMKLSIPYTSDSFFSGAIEGVYTSPFMYHRAFGGEYESDTSKLLKDLYFTYTIRQSIGGIVVKLSDYLSYPFGSDAIAALCKFGYSKVNKFDLTGYLFYMVHGVIRADSLTNYYGAGENKTYTPSTQNPFDPSNSGVVEHSFIIGFNSSFAILKNLDLTAGTSFETVWNKGNVKQPALSGFALHFGLSYKL